MKLNEHHTRQKEPRLKATGVLSAELGGEPSLNERIGLTPRLEKDLRTFLETRTDELAQLVQQVEVAIYLTTLFPTVAEQLKQQAPVGQLIERLHRGRSDFHNEGTLNHWYLISHFAPEKLPLIPSDIADGRVQTIKSGLSGIWGFELAAQGIRLFPARAKEFREAIQPQLDDLDLDLNTLPEDDVLSIAMDVLSLDPSLHAKFHAFALTHQADFESLFTDLAQPKNPVPRGKKTRWFASYKLLLADEIQVSSTGLLFAVEKAPVGQVSPLPERDHSQ